MFLYSSIGVINIYMFLYSSILLETGSFQLLNLIQYVHVVSKILNLIKIRPTYYVVSRSDFN